MEQTTSLNIMQLMQLHDIFQHSHMKHSIQLMREASFSCPHRSCIHDSQGVVSRWNVRQLQHLLLKVTPTEPWQVETMQSWCLHASVTSAELPKISDCLSVLWHLFKPLSQQQELFLPVSVPWFRWSAFKRRCLQLFHKHSSPIRLLLPRQCQKCRLRQLLISHMLLHLSVTCSLFSVHGEFVNFLFTLLNFANSPHQHEQVRSWGIRQFPIHFAQLHRFTPSTWTSDTKQITSVKISLLCFSDLLPGARRSMAPCSWTEVSIPRFAYVKAWGASTRGPPSSRGLDKKAPLSLFGGSMSFHGLIWSRWMAFTSSPRSWNEGAILASMRLRTCAIVWSSSLASLRTSVNTPKMPSMSSWVWPSRK